MAYDSEKTYMSGEELYKFLHISKRKMRYLIVNGYIPSIDTGKKTHRFKVNREDAIRFKEEMEKHPDILMEIKGMFGCTPPKRLIEPTEYNSQRFKQYLTQLWKDEPDALTTKRAAELIGVDYRRIDGLCRNSKIVSVKIGSRFICLKISFIEYCASKEMLVKPQMTDIFEEIVLGHINQNNKC